MEGHRRTAHRAAGRNEREHSRARVRDLSARAGRILDVRERSLVGDERDPAAAAVGQVDRRGERSVALVYAGRVSAAYRLLGKPEELVGRGQ